MVTVQKLKDLGGGPVSFTVKVDIDTNHTGTETSGVDHILRNGFEAIRIHKPLITPDSRLELLEEPLFTAINEEGITERTELRLQRSLPIELGTPFADEYPNVLLRVVKL